MSYSKNDDFEDQLTEALNKGQTSLNPEVEQILQKLLKENQLTKALDEKTNKTYKTSLNPEEEAFLQYLLKEEQALILRLQTLAANRKAFAGVKGGGKKRTIRKKNRKGRRTMQRKNRTRIHKKARKSMKRKTSRRK